MLSRPTPHTVYRTHHHLWRGYPTESAWRPRAVGCRWSPTSRGPLPTPRATWTVRSADRPPCLTFRSMLSRESPSQKLSQTFQRRSPLGLLGHWLAESPLIRTAYRCCPSLTRHSNLNPIQTQNPQGASRYG